MRRPKRSLPAAMSITSPSPDRSKADARWSARRPARSLTLGLELGGKDPAYVTPDANLSFAVENLVDGAFFNSGQCCCGIERIYVHEARYDAFVAGLRRADLAICSGQSPASKATTLGPMARASLAEIVRAQTREAIAKGAQAASRSRSFRHGQAGQRRTSPRKC